MNDSWSLPLIISLWSGECGRCFWSILALICKTNGNKMVRQCQVCGKLDTFNPELSFHRFPTNPERRNLWLSLVELNKGQPLPKHPEICSDHFLPSDIIIKGNGLRYVKPGAYPQLIDPHSESTTEISSDSTVYETPPPRKSTGLQSISFEDLSTAPESTSVPEDRVPLAKIKTQTDEEPSSSATMTASEAEYEMQKFSQINPHQVADKPVSKKRKRRYIGDMTSSDFSTPEKRRKNLKIVKETVTGHRKQIHTLQMTVRRLRLRIKTLESLLTYLKEKCLISESSEPTIKASVSGPAVDLFERLLKGPSTQKYNASLRSFALTLAFYSAKAYNFVRNTFNKSLPHLGTLSKWYRTVDKKKK